MRSNVPFGTSIPEILSRPREQVKPLLLLPPTWLEKTALRICIQGLADTWRLLESTGVRICYPPSLLSCLQRPHMHSLGLHPSDSELRCRHKAWVSLQCRFSLIQSSEQGPPSGSAFH